MNFRVPTFSNFSYQGKIMDSRNHMRNAQNLKHICVDQDMVEHLSNPQSGFNTLLKTLEDKPVSQLLFPSSDMKLRGFNADQSSAVSLNKKEMTKFVGELSTILPHIKYTSRIVRKKERGSKWDAGSFLRFINVKSPREKVYDAERVKQKRLRESQKSLTLSDSDHDNSTKSPKQSNTDDVKKIPNVIFKQLGNLKRAKQLQNAALQRRRRARTDQEGNAPVVSVYDVEQEKIARRHQRQVTQEQMALYRTIYVTRDWEAVCLEENSVLGEQDVAELLQVAKHAKYQQTRGHGGNSYAEQTHNAILQSKIEKKIQKFLPQGASLNSLVQSQTLQKVERLKNKISKSKESPSNEKLQQPEEQIHKKESIRNLNRRGKNQEQIELKQMTQLSPIKKERRLFMHSVKGTVQQQQQSPYQLQKSQHLVKTSVKTTKNESREVPPMFITEFGDADNVATLRAPGKKRILRASSSLTVHHDKEEEGEEEAKPQQFSILRRPVKNRQNAQSSTAIKQRETIDLVREKELLRNISDIYKSSNEITKRYLIMEKVLNRNIRQEEDEIIGTLDKTADEFKIGSDIDKDKTRSVKNEQVFIEDEAVSDLNNLSPEVRNKRLNTINSELCEISSYVQRLRQENVQQRRPKHLRDINRDFPIQLMPKTIYKTNRKGALRAYN